MSHSQPLLAIAIPTHNRGDYLARLLARLSKELEGVPDVVVHISDNASTDHTPDVVAAFAAYNPHVRSTRQSRNVGPDENFCCLIDSIDAKYVWLFGDDDIPYVGAIATALSLLIRLEPDTMYLSSTWGDTTETPPVDGAPRFDVMHRHAFARRVHIWTTFISGWIVRTDLAQVRPTRRYIGTQLVQLGWVLAAVELGERHVYVVTPMVRATSGNSGGYSALTVFGSSYAKVTRDALAKSPAQRRLAQAMIRRAAVAHIPGLIRALRAGVAGDLTDGPSARDLEPADVGGLLWRRLILETISSARPPAAVVAFATSKGVARALSLADLLRSKMRRGAHRA